MNFKKSIWMVTFFTVLAAVLWHFGNVHPAIGFSIAATAAIPLTEEQMAEFRSILEGLKGYKEMFPALKDLGAGIEGGFAAIKELPKNLKELAENYKRIEEDNKKLRKAMLSRDTGSGVRWVGNVPFVTDDCAKSLTGMYILSCAQRGQWPVGLRDEKTQQRLIGASAELMGLEVKTALSATEIPVPTVYVPQIVELVWKYGQIRQFATVFPLGAGTVKPPRLAAGEDTFGYMGVGTAGMSQSVGEKRVTAELVTFTANKCGGIVRIPTELEEDSFIAVGQFIARYIARRFAYLEDNTGFNGDGTATFANISGISKYATTNTTYLEQLATGKTKPSDATLAAFRSMRARVAAAAYANGAYYMHPTMDALLVTFNTSATVTPYQRLPNGSATLDGFPIRWTGVHAAYSTTASANAHLADFGDLSYTYLGERGAPRVDTSRDVYFATDEIGMRALERIDFQIVGIDAISALLTAAS